MSWIELKLDIPNTELEKVSAYIFAHGCQGINVMDDAIIVYFSTHHWTDEVKIALTNYIRQVVPGFTQKNFQVRAMTDHDWNADWKKHFKPVKVTSSVVVYPPWEKYRAGQGEMAVKINPKMAFGTGHHESTRLVIIEMEKIIRPGMHVLDVGTGSGILAIIARKMGAESVLGLDNDMEAIKNATENLNLNKINAGVQFGYGELEQVTPSDYDVVLANINKNTLMQYAPMFPQYLKIGGMLILSGILRMDELDITRTFHSHGFQVKKMNVIKDWLAVVMELKEKADEESSN